MKRSDEPLIERLRCGGTLLCRPAYDPTYLCTRCEGAEALQAAEDELTRFREWHASYDALGITGLVELLTAAEAKLAAIDALHRRAILVGLCDYCTQWWPCETYRILHPKEGP